MLVLVGQIVEKKSWRVDERVKIRFQGPKGKGVADRQRGGCIIILRGFAYLNRVTIATMATRITMVTMIIMVTTVTTVTMVTKVTMVTILRKFTIVTMISLVT